MLTFYLVIVTKVVSINNTLQESKMFFVVKTMSMLGAVAKATVQLEDIRKENSATTSFVLDSIVDLGKNAPDLNLPLVL